MSRPAHTEPRFQASPAGRSPLLPVVVATGLCATLVAVTIARNTLDRTAIAAKAPAVHAPSTRAEAAILTAPMRPVQRQEPVEEERTDVIHRDGPSIRIDADALPRATAAARLAAVTGDRIRDPQALLPLAPALTLHWQGTDPMEAWRRVLGPGIRHSIVCARGTCRIELLSMEVEGGTVIVPETSDPPRPPARAGDAPEPYPGPMNTPDPAGLDESSLGG